MKLLLIVLLKWIRSFFKITEHENCSSELACDSNPKLAFVCTNLIQRRSDTIHEGVPDIFSSRGFLACPAAGDSRGGRRRYFLPLLDSI